MKALTKLFPFFCFIFFFFFFFYSQNETCATLRPLLAPVDKGCTVIVATGKKHICEITNIKCFGQYSPHGQSGI